MPIMFASIFITDTLLWTLRICPVVSFYPLSNTPGNVVSGNQNYANEILTGASGHDLQSVDRMSTNLLSRYLQISKRENRQFGNVVPNSFHFYKRLITKLHGKASCQLLF